MTQRTTVWVCCVALWASCGDDSAPPPGMLDSGSRDASVDTAVACLPFAAGVTGSRCESDADCRLPGALCLDEREGYLDEGYCTRACSSDTDCGSAAFCAEVSSIAEPEGMTLQLCVADCCEGLTCPAGHLCQSVFAGFGDIVQPGCMPGDGTKLDGDACEGSYECNVDSLCLSDVETPGGYCTTIDCTVGDDRTCTGGLCGQPADSERSFCAATCSSDADCRMAEGYRCIDAGAVRLCAHAHVGDACTTDGDCGVGPWTCQGFAGGYCTLSCSMAGEECGSGDLCFDSAGSLLCVDSCEADGDCRGGYTCAAILGGRGCVPS